MGGGTGEGGRRERFPRAILASLLLAVLVLAGRAAGAPGSCHRTGEPALHKVKVWRVFGFIALSIGILLILLIRYAAIFGCPVAPAAPTARLTDWRAVGFGLPASPSTRRRRTFCADGP